MANQRLEILSGPLKGTHIEIVGALTIGRSRENGLQVSDLQVSRRHAVIQQTPSGTILRDLGSGNGTYVGQHRILEHALKQGELITIGNLCLKFEETSKADVPEEHTAAIPRHSIIFNAAEERPINTTAAASVYQSFMDLDRSGGTSAQLHSAQARLAAIYQATQIITSERNINRLLARIMDQLFELVPAHNGVLLLKHPRTGELTAEYTRTGSGLNDIIISSSIVQRAFRDGEAVLSRNATSDDRFDAGLSIVEQNITSVMCVPLEHQDETFGALYVDTRGTTSAFSQNDLELMVALSRTAAIAIRNARYLAQVEKGYRDTIVVLANAIEMRDHYTVGHTWRVTRFAVEIARKLGWDEARLSEVERGGILHDAGKIAVDDAILRKPGRLTEEEYAKMKIHPERGARMMKDVEFLVPLIPYALYHHERWDGNGYPFGLGGEDIPMEGRIVAVADTLDAMTSNRPYRKGMDIDTAIEEIRNGRGTQFDPTCVDVLLACHQEGSIHKVLQNYYRMDGRSMACPFCSTFIRIPEGASPAQLISCNVCHRRLLVRFENDAFFGELIPESDALNNPATFPDGPIPETPKGGA